MLLLLTVLMFSARCRLQWIVNESSWASIHSGRLEIVHFSLPSRVRFPGLYLDRFDHTSLHWRIRWEKSRFVFNLAVPIWLFVALAALPTIAAWRVGARVNRRLRSGCCLNCGYDRRGIPQDAVCPECSHEVAA